VAQDWRDAIWGGAAQSAAGTVYCRRRADELAKSQQPNAKRALQEICNAETKADAEATFDAFIESYQVKYEKQPNVSNGDRDVLLTFYDFPAERWKHLRTTNPIEATFVTVRHRTVRSKGCLAPRSLTPSPKIGDSFSVPSTGALWQKFTGDSANVYLPQRELEGITQSSRPWHRRSMPA
jgi:hypothetical protein